jgi:hypothetical protein
MEAVPIGRYTTNVVSNLYINGTNSTTLTKAKTAISRMAAEIRKTDQNFDLGKIVFDTAVEKGDKREAGKKLTILKNIVKKQVARIDQIVELMRRADDVAIEMKRTWRDVPLGHDEERGFAIAVPDGRTDWTAMFDTQLIIWDNKNAGYEVLLRILNGKLPK